MKHPMQHPVKLPVSHAVNLPDTLPPHIVRAAIARAMRGQHASPALGTLTLMPHQQDAELRVTEALRDLHVALLADDVGVGKTYVALAVARRYQQVLVLAPAALLPMWRTAIARAQSTAVTVRSIQSYSRSIAASHTPRPPRSLVIIDEAHHVRTPATQRHAAIAREVTGCDLLLMSATPVHNSRRDLAALLSLALGARANHLSGALLARVVVRRTMPSALPTPVTHTPIDIPHDPALLDAVLALPAPLPAHDGAIAGALIRLGLVRAWCSSDGALTHALRQRLSRGEVLKQALLAGRHPTSAEMRSWLIGDHEVQLAFPELMAQHAPITAPLLEVLDTHLNAVHTLLHFHTQGACGDAARANALRRLLVQHDGVPIVAFSQFASTVRTIGRALRDIAGVGILTGQDARIASGRISRAEALAHFAPVAQGLPPPPAHQRIRLLLTTDILAEGVNLQDAGVVVHLDLPWTDALRAQRVGRCVRTGSAHHTVHVHAMRPPPKAEQILRLHARLQNKARIASRLVGAPAEPGRGSSAIAMKRLMPLMPADAATALRDELAEWVENVACVRMEGETECPIVVGTLESCTSTVTLYLAAVNSPLSGFLAVDRNSAGRLQLVGGVVEQRNDKSCIVVSTAPRRLYPLALAASVEQSEPATLRSDDWERTRRALGRWRARHDMREELGNATSHAKGEWAQSKAHTRMRAAIAKGIAKLPPGQRIQIRKQAVRAREIVDNAHGIAAERALDAWREDYRKTPLANWLKDFAKHPELTRIPVTESKKDAHTTINQNRAVAILVLQTL